MLPKTWYGVPPVAVAVAVPSDPPLQLTSVVLVAPLSTVGSLIVAVAVVAQPLPSVIVAV